MNKRKNGFTMISILVITLVLFSLVSLALSANYRLHLSNKQMAENIQKRANKIKW